MDIVVFTLYQSLGQPSICFGNQLVLVTLIIGPFCLDRLRAGSSSFPNIFHIFRILYTKLLYCLLKMEIQFF